MCLPGADEGAWAGVSVAGLRICVSEVVGHPQLWPAWAQTTSTDRGRTTGKGGRPIEPQRPRAPVALSVGAHASLLRFLLPRGRSVPPPWAATAPLAEEEGRRWGRAAHRGAAWRRRPSPPRPAPPCGAGVPPPALAGRHSYAPLSLHLTLRVLWEPAAVVSGEWVYGPPAVSRHVQCTSRRGLPPVGDVRVQVG